MRAKQSIAKKYILTTLWFLQFILILNRSTSSITAKKNIHYSLKEYVLRNSFYVYICAFIIFIFKKACLPSLKAFFPQDTNWEGVEWYMKQLWTLLLHMRLSKSHYCACVVKKSILMSTKILTGLWNGSTSFEAWISVWWDRPEYKKHSD